MDRFTILTFCAAMAFVALVSWLDSRQNDEKSFWEAFWGYLNPAGVGQVMAKMARRRTKYRRRLKRKVRAWFA